MLDIFRPSIRPLASLRQNHHLLLPPPGPTPPLVIVYHLNVLPPQRPSRDLLAITEGSRGEHANAALAALSPSLAFSTVQAYASG
mmetsp:Transcript_5002/g.12738  ORF Transcript_5002/g.12738 Transcript_5002/m.12738 type:complete len:85 (+) Transcript_5002:1548-1802(+)